MDGLSVPHPARGDLPAHEVEQLIHEHHALLRHYARVQMRCAEQLSRQATELRLLRAQAMRQQAAIVVRDTALAWAREDRQALEASVPGLSRRAALSRKVETLMGRIQELMRDRLHRQPRPPAEAPCEAAAVDAHDMAVLEQSLVTADLVICQTGCLSHGAYWRVQDHCRRTGKACVLVEQPDAVRIVRIRADTAVDSATATAT